VLAQKRATVKLVIQRRIRQPRALSGSTNTRGYRTGQQRLPLFDSTGTPVARLHPHTKTLWRCNAMTRTLGAAIGAAVVLLFFASLTFEQNRVLTIARAAVGSHR
jgi:hypothetical protein